MRGIAGIASRHSQAWKLSRRTPLRRPHGAGSRQLLAVAGLYRPLAGLWPDVALTRSATHDGVVFGYKHESLASLPVRWSGLRRCEVVRYQPTVSSGLCQHRPLCASSPNKIFLTQTEQKTRASVIGRRSSTIVLRLASVRADPLLSLSVARETVGASLEENPGACPWPWHH